MSNEHRQTQRTYAGLKVFVSPALESGEYIIGVLNNAAKVAAAVYAPLACCA